jgi:hypothetical protein
MTTSDAEFGCSAFGHLASPFVDGEIGRDESESFATHLDACHPCQKIIAAYRALDVIARRGPTPVAATDWDRAWTGIAAAIEADREAAASAPLASVARLASRLVSGAPGSRKGSWLRPLGYAAAATILVALSLSLQRRWDVPTESERVAIQRHAPQRAGGSSAPVAPLPAPSKLMSISCLAPDFVPVIYTVAGEEPMTVVQCAHVGPLAAATGPTEG